MPLLLAMNVSLTCRDQHVFLMCLWMFIRIQSFSQGFVAGVFSQAYQRVDGNLWVDYFDRFRPDFDCTSGFKNMHVFFTIVHHSTMVNYPMYLRAPNKLQPWWPFRKPRTQLINPGNLMATKKTGKLGGFCRWMENDAAKNVIRIACILALSSDGGWLSVLRVQ